MLRIHGSARSRAQRTLWMVYELGIPFEHDDLTPRSPGTKTPEFLALNPNSTLAGDRGRWIRAVQIDGDQFLPRQEAQQSAVSLRSKARSPCPAMELLGDRPTGPPLANYLTHTSLLPEAERDKAIADAAWADVEPAMNALNGALGKASWLAGPAFSIADLNVACALWRGLSMDLSRGPR